MKTPGTLQMQLHLTHKTKSSISAINQTGYPASSTNKQTETDIASVTSQFLCFEIIYILTKWLHLLEKLRLYATK
jgi:hypothetical protein